MKKSIDDCPCCGQKLPKAVFAVDDKFRVVMRGGRGVALPIGQFAIFRALYKGRTARTTNQLVDEVYRGAEPPARANASVHVMIRCLNQYLVHVGLRVRSNHPGRLAFWRLSDEER